MSSDDIDHLAEEIERRQGEADRRKSGGVLRSDIAKTLLHLVITALLAYGVMNARLAVVESRVDGFSEQLSEIRQDIKTLLGRR